MMHNDRLTIHSDHFEDLALDIAGDLLNRGLLPENNTNFDTAIRIIVWRLKHQKFINDNPADYMDSPSKGPIDQPLKEP